VTRRAVGKIEVVRVGYAPGTMRTRTDCPDWQLWWILRGGWTQEKAGTSQELAGGSASRHAPREPCRQKVAPCGIALLGVQVPRSSVPPGNALRREGLGIALAGVQVAFAQNEALLLEEAIASLFDAAPEQTDTAWLRRVTERLHDDYATPLRLAELAAETGVHEVHLAASFRARKGCTVGEYLRRLRLDAALHRLCATDDNLATIAAATGFHDQAHLTRLFRARVGVPPGAFRQRLP
jgi:AraC-like DNA-binding protein